MNINELIAKKNLSVYKLSKISGVPTTTLFDITSGRSNILDCRVRVLINLAKALDIDINEIILLEPVYYNDAYEHDMPDFLEEAVINLKRNRRSSCYDCYSDELNSSINVCETENLISKQQADYLRKKYLEM